MTRSDRTPPWRGNATVGRLILSAIARFRAQPAVSDGARSWTYGELGEAIARVIAVLKDLGVKRGDGFAMLMGNCVEQIACQYAAVLLGIRYTALHPLASTDTHVFILNDAEASLLILDPRLAGLPISELRSRVPRLRHVLSLGPLDGAIDLSAATAKAEPAQLHDEADAGSVAYLFYTGGTTGRPKGAMLPHRSLVATFVEQAADWDLPSGDMRFLAATPTTHASGIIVPTVLLRGGYVRLAAGFDPENFCRIVAEEKINFTFLVPTMLYMLMDHPASNRHDLSSLETVMYGAAPMSPDRLRSAIARFGQIFVQLYGQTEVPMVITTLRKRDHDLTRPDLLGSCGLPGPSTEVKLLDGDLQEVAPGKPGEICVRGPIVMDGYWNSPELTDAAFAGGWMHTGDVATRSEDGYLTIVDRTKDMIITGGFNVYPREVEDALLAHEAVSTAAVIGVPDEKWGEAVTAFVVLRAGAAVDAAALQAHVRALRGPMCSPKTIHFVSQVPLTSLGKLDRKALRARATTSAAS